jgi:carbonic anhydrase/acetyltransferase-like protein (isoleucine patch superfamily)
MYFIGGFAKIGPGVKIGSNSIIGVESVVLPDTVIGDYEYWSGNPAKKRKSLDKEELVQA